MSVRRTEKKGSFLGQFDELVTKFPDASRGCEKRVKAGLKDERHINDRLLDIAPR